MLEIAEALNYYMDSSNSMNVCDIDDEEFNKYEQENGVSPCSDYGMCENCPYFLLM